MLACTFDLLSIDLEEIELFEQESFELRIKYYLESYQEEIKERKKCLSNSAVGATQKHIAVEYTQEVDQFFAYRKHNGATYVHFGTHQGLSFE